MNPPSTNSSSTGVSASFFSRIWAYLQMMRPANILTAWADILAGCAAADVWSTVDIKNGNISLSGDVLNQVLSQPHLWSIVWLLVATTGLYGGGVVFNDVFDAELDAVERPERPIPSGRASRQASIILGLGLLFMGAIAAAQVSWLSMALAIGIALSALLYDSVSKHSAIWGPLNMGLCRGGNLVLGLTVIPALAASSVGLMVIPILYIGAITAVSQGEVFGGKQRTGAIALFLIASVLGILTGLSLLPSYSLWSALPFVILLGILTLPAFIQATRTPTPDCIRRAVKAGILSLIVLDAALSAGFGGWIYGLIVLALLPLSRKLAQVFAVT